MTRKAVLDIGSYSVLLLVADRGPEGWVGLHERSRITRLSEGLSRSGKLSEEAMERTLAACKDLAAEARAFEPNSLIAVGTMALRKASNASELIRALDQEGIYVKLLSGEQEARYSYLAVVKDPLFAHSEPIVVDIGGASTEVASEHSMVSLPIGAQVLVEERLGLGPCSSEAVALAADLVDAHSIALEGLRGNIVCTVGSTGVNLASLVEGKGFDPSKVHGFRLSMEMLQLQRHQLCAMSAEERAALTSLESGREPVIHAGALILERVIRALGHESVSISSRGLRWGILEESECCV